MHRSTHITPSACAEVDLKPSSKSNALSYHVMSCHIMPYYPDRKKNTDFIARRFGVIPFTLTAQHIYEHLLCHVRIAPSTCLEVELKPSSRNALSSLFPMNTMRHPRSSPSAHRPASLLSKKKKKGGLRLYDMDTSTRGTKGRQHNGGKFVSPGGITGESGASTREKNGSNHEDAKA